MEFGSQQSFTAYTVGSEVGNVEGVEFPDDYNQGHSTE